MEGRGGARAPSLSLDTLRPVNLSATDVIIVRRAFDREETAVENTCLFGQRAVCIAYSL